MPKKPRPEVTLVFQPEFLDDLRYWIRTQPKTALRIVDLVDAVRRDPAKRIGKPEPLRHLHPGMWSRRITQEHRLVYLVRQNRVDFLQARYHY